MQEDSKLVNVAWQQDQNWCRKIKKILQSTSREGSLGNNGSLLPCWEIICVEVVTGDGGTTSERSTFSAIAWNHFKLKNKHEETYIKWSKKMNVITKIWDDVGLQHSTM